MTPERMVCYLLHRQIIVNHLPWWRIERDWSYEVTASNGVVIARCQTQEEAEEIIQLAEKIKKEDNTYDDLTSEVLEGFSRACREPPQGC